MEVMNSFAEKPSELAEWARKEGIFLHRSWAACPEEIHAGFSLSAEKAEARWKKEQLDVYYWLAKSNHPPLMYFSLSRTWLISNLLCSLLEDKNEADREMPSLAKQILCLLLLSGNPGEQRMEEPGMEQ